jgi:hypothetical protein
MDRSHAPADPAERMKLTMTHCEMTKQDIDSGRLKMWGVNPGGKHGFAVADGDEKEICAMVIRFIPHVKFRVGAMLSIDEVIATLKGVHQKT